MSETRVIPVSRLKAALLLLGSIGFVALSYWATDAKPLMAWAGVVFFALGIPVALVMMFTDSMSLALDSEAMEMRSPVNTTRVRWQDIAGFEMAQVKGAKMIEIVYRDHYRDQAIGRRLAKAVSGMQGGIANNYAMPLPDLLAELRAWHARHGQAGA